jgi:hypothetical protein
MVEIITDPTVDETYVSPKLSPRKYKKGSNNASKRKYFLSAFLTPLNPLVTHRNVESRTVAMHKRMKTIVIGS